MSKFFIQHSQAHPTKCSCWIGLLLFHPIFHSCDAISNVKTSNFEWFNKIKTLCKIITIKISYTCTYLAFCLDVAFHLQSLQALTVSLAKPCPSSSLICHWMKEWMDLHVGWHVQTMQTIIQHSCNIYSTFHPTCWIKYWIVLTTMP